jgi:hypothetical protein
MLPVHEQNLTKRVKFSKSINNLIIFGFIVVISSFGIVILAKSSFAEEFTVITATPFTHKIPVLITFLSGVISVYVAVLKLWRDLDSRQNALFLAVGSLLLLGSVIALLSWLNTVYGEVNVSFNKLQFPTDVDQVTTSVQLSLLKVICFMFGVFGVIGVVSFIVSLVHIKVLSSSK